jgi:hypothetical protein
VIRTILIAMIVVLLWTADVRLKRIECLMSPQTCGDILTRKSSDG